MSSPSSRPSRKSRNVPPARIMDDMFEYFPPVATVVKEEQIDTDDERTKVTPKKKRRTGTPKKLTSSEEIMSQNVEAVPGKVELDEVNEEDFDMGGADGVNLREDMTQDGTTTNIHMSAEDVHKKPVFRQVAFLPAGSEAQKKFLQILNMGNATVRNNETFPRSLTAFASENGHSDNKKDLKEDMEECDICGKALKNFKKPRRHLWECRKVGNEGICPKCGEVRKWRVPSMFKRHVATCDPIKKMCKEDHEHKFIDKTFETFKDGIAHFYDNEYDTELSISSGNKSKSRKQNNVKYEYLLFTCGRSIKGEYVYQGTTGRSNIKKRLDKKCPAYIIMRGGWLNGRDWAGVNDNNAAVTRMYGCTVHNHPDNPTMKRVSWLTKRRIAKFLLLGHSRFDIRSNLMPKFHVEGHKKVDIECVKRIQRIMEKDKHHKLREGHDLVTLLGTAKATERGVYPWPTQTNCPLRIAAHKEHSRKILETKAKKKAQKELVSNGEMKPGPPHKSLGEREEVEKAVSSIEEESYNIDSPGAGASRTTEATQGDNVAPPGDVFVPVPERDSNLEVMVASSENHIVTEGPHDSTLGTDDVDVDPQAFEKLREKALRCLGPLGFPGTIAERLSPRISALEASGAGMAVLRKILQVVQQDLTLRHFLSAICRRANWIFHFLA